jgi:hypothetical protein
MRQTLSFSIFFLQEKGSFQGRDVTVAHQLRSRGPGNAILTSYLVTRNAKVIRELVREMCEFDVFQAVKIALPLVEKIKI